MSTGAAVAKIEALVGRSRKAAGPTQGGHAAGHQGRTDQTVEHLCTELYGIELCYTVESCCQGHHGIERAVCGGSSSSAIMLCQRGSRLLYSPCSTSRGRGGLALARLQRQVETWCWRWTNSSSSVRTTRPRANQCAAEDCGAQEAAGGGVDSDVLAVVAHTLPDTTIVEATAVGGPTTR